MKINFKSIIAFAVMVFAGMAMNLSLQGCAGFFAKQSGVTSNIDMLIESQKYDKALKIIAAIPPEHEQYEELAGLARAIEEKRRLAISDILDRARGFERKKDWGKAVDLLDKALKTFPDETQIAVKRDKYKTLRTQSINKNKKDITIARGRYFADTRANEENLLRAAPDCFFARRRYQNYQREVKQLSRDIYIIGKEAADENNTPAAIEALTLSTRLFSNEKSRTLLLAIYESEREKRASARKESIDIAKNRLPEITDNFRRAVQANDLAGAHRLIEEMAGIDHKEAEISKELLDKRIDRSITALQNRGRMLYGQGFIKDALDVWQKALQLAPDHPELLQSAHRAKTFLENLEKWKE